MEARRLPGRRPASVDAALLVAGGLFLLGVGLRVWFMAAYRPAFMGYGDSHAYIRSAAGDLFQDPLHTVGYPLFLRGVHLLSDDLSFTILVQHALGVASAGVVYLIVRRLGGSRWLALVPAAVVLLDGHQLFLEHSVMSEAAFTFLLLGALYAAVRGMDEGSVVWAAASGAALGVAATVRPLALVVLLVVAVWLVAASEKHRRGAGMALAALSVGLVPLGAYLGAQYAATDKVALTRGGGWQRYALAAPFADCERFDPPAGTRVLCESRPGSQRPGTEFYIWNEESPGRRAFGNRFDRNGDRLGAWARAAILHQPLDYVGGASKNFVRFAVPWIFVRSAGGSGLGPHGAIDYLQERSLEAEMVIERFYDTHGFMHSGERGLDLYGKGVEVAGPPLGLALILALLAPVIARGRARRGALLLVASGVTLLAVPVLTVHYEARYAVPAYGPLVAAAALGAAEAYRRLKAARAYPRAHVSA